MKHNTVIPEHLLKLMDPKDRAALGKTGRTKDEIATANQIRNERQLHEQVIALLRLRGVAWVHHSRMDKPQTGGLGTPDFLFSYRGVPCAIECKVGNNTTSDEQRETMIEMRKDGWRVIVAYNLETVKAFLDQFTEKPIRSHE